MTILKFPGTSDVAGLVLGLRQLHDGGARLDGETDGEPDGEPDEEPLALRVLRAAGGSGALESRRKEYKEQ